MRIKIAIPTGMYPFLDWKASKDMKLSVGDWVLVPFGKKELWGVVLKVEALLKVQIKEKFELKSVLKKLDKPPISSLDLAFWVWIADYYLASLNQVLASALPQKWVDFYQNSSAGFDDKNKILLKNISDIDKPLTLGQTKILQDWKADVFGRYLLHGVTGSGKTRVFLEMAAHVILQQKKVMWLIPEIALTYQVIAIVEAEFNKVVVLHSGLSVKQTKESWAKILKKDYDVILGTRRAVLVPIENLGLIIFDEEHDSSYKQSNLAPKYHAKDLALWRSGQLGAGVVLGSATPSLESYYLANQGKLKLLELKERVHKGDLPTTFRIDMAEQHRLQGKLSLSWVLREKLIEVKKRGEQAILFCARRGYQKVQLCSGCGEAVKCDFCSVSLVYHKTKKRLKCHYCGFNCSSETTCKTCNSKDWIHEGSGIQKVEEELKKWLPNHRVLRLDRDITSKKGALAKTLTSFREGEADILLGTQMVVKGHDFAKVNLVGVIVGDSSLQSTDFRVNERFFQTITQVSGRAGRLSGGGEVYLQSFEKSSPIVELAMRQDYLGFVKKEFKDREALFYPPYSRAIVLELNGLEIKVLYQELNYIKTDLINALNITTEMFKEIRVLGPTDAPIARMGGWWRVRLLFIVSRGSAGALKKELMNSTRVQHLISGGNIKVNFDVDPLFEH
jgi:primosomal protein N' (replication factor Y) (superfamily II helicase)